MPQDVPFFVLQRADRDFRLLELEYYDIAVILRSSFFGRVSIICRSVKLVHGL